MQHNSHSIDLEFRLQPSQTMIAWQIFVAVLALVAVRMLQLDWPIKILLLLIVIFAAGYAIRHAALRSESAVLSLRSIIAEKAWILTFRTGHRIKVSHLGHRVARHLVVLHVRDETLKRKRSIFIASDALSFEQHRQLRALVLAMRAPIK